MHDKQLLAKTTEQHCWGLLRRHMLYRPIHESQKCDGSQRNQTKGTSEEDTVGWCQRGHRTLVNFPFCSPNWKSFVQPKTERKVLNRIAGKILQSCNVWTRMSCKLVAYTYRLYFPFTSSWSSCTVNLVCFYINTLCDQTGCIGEYDKLVCRKWKDFSNKMQNTAGVYLHHTQNHKSSNIWIHQRQFVILWWHFMYTLFLN